MSAYISSNAIFPYSAIQKSQTPSLFSLPTEIQQEVESYLDAAAWQNFFKALITVTRDGEPIDSPTLKFHLLLQKVPSEYQQAIAKSDASLHAFAWNQLQLLWESGQLDQVVEKTALFKLILLACDPAILEFLREKIQQEPDLKQKLLNWVERSKTEEVQPIAANTLALFVKAGVALSGQDFSGIRVPGADLSSGIFDHTGFENADISGSNLRGAWLRQADLRHAKLDNVKFGELPTLEVGERIDVCCYSPNGQWLAVGGSGSIKLYEAKTLKLTHTFSVNQSSDINSLTFSADGKWLAAGESRYGEYEIYFRGSTDVVVNLWSIENNSETTPKIFEGYYSASFSADSKWLALKGFYEVKLWDVESDFDRVLETYEDLDYPVNMFLDHSANKISFSADGKWLAFGRKDSIRLYDAKTQEFKYTFGVKERIDTSVFSFSANGKWLVAANHTDLKLWNIESGPQQVPKTFAKHNHSGVVSIAFSPDSKWLASGGDSTVTLWSIESGAAQATKAWASYCQWVKSLSFSTDSKWLAILWSGVQLWEVGNTPNTFESRSLGADSLSLSTDGKWLASRSLDDNTVKLWCLENSSAQVLKMFEGHTEKITSISLSADGKWLAAGNQNGTVNLWNVEDCDSLEKKSKTFSAHLSKVYSVSLSADGKWLASGGEDCTAKLWNTESDSEQEPKTFSFNDRVWGVSLSADGKWLASGKRDAVSLWSVESGSAQATKIFAGVNQYQGSVSFSADGKWLASKGANFEVKLWSVENSPGQTPKTFTGHTREVTSFSLSANGKWLASGSRDKTVKLWSISSEQCVATIKDFHSSVNSAVWRQTEKGKTQLIIGGADNSIQLWRIEEKGDTCEALLEWRSCYPQVALTATGARLEGAVGLSELNTRLLNQLGAEAES